MKSLFIFGVCMLLVINIAAGCAPAGNPFKGTAGENNRVAGFWLGIWQGLIAPFAFIASLFRSNIGVYETHNNGAWYNFGFLFGLACFFGGGGGGAARRR